MTILNAPFEKKYCGGQYLFYKLIGCKPVSKEYKMVIFKILVANSSVS
jgi:hypothetical protein